MSDDRDNPKQKTANLELAIAGIQKEHGKGSIMRLKDGQSFLDEIPDDVEPAGHGRSICEDFDPQRN